LLINFYAEFIRILEIKCIPYMYLFQTEMLSRVVPHEFGCSRIFGRGVQRISDTLEVYHSTGNCVLNVSVSATG
jgi:hypothetical protein